MEGVSALYQFEHIPPFLTTVVPDEMQLAMIFCIESLQTSFLFLYDQKKHQLFKTFFKKSNKTHQIIFHDK